MRIKSFSGKIREYFSALGHLTPVAFVNTFLPFAGSALLISMAYPLGFWLKENWEIGSLFYLAGLIIVCGLSLLPTNVIGLIGGWAFSFDLGLMLLITGICGAALLSFLLNSRIVGDRLPHVLESHPKAQVIYRALVGESVWRTTLIIFLIRFGARAFKIVSDRDFFRDAPALVGGGFCRLRTLRTEPGEQGRILDAGLRHRRHAVVRLRD
jgi:hypothetical protein